MENQTTAYGCRIGQDKFMCCSQKCKVCGWRGESGRCGRETVCWKKGKRRFGGNENPKRGRLKTVVQVLTSLKLRFQTAF